MSSFGLARMLSSTSLLNSGSLVTKVNVCGIPGVLPVAALFSKTIVGEPAAPVVEDVQRAVRTELPVHEVLDAVVADRHDLLERLGVDGQSAVPVVLRIGDDRVARLVGVVEVADEPLAVPVGGPLDGAGGR